MDDLFAAFQVHDDVVEEAAHGPNYAVTPIPPPYQAKILHANWFMPTLDSTDAVLDTTGFREFSSYKNRIDYLYSCGKYDLCCRLCDITLPRFATQQARKLELLDTAVRSSMRLGNLTLARSYLNKLEAIKTDDAYWLASADLATLENNFLGAQECLQHVLKYTTSNPSLWTIMAKNCLNLAKTRHEWLWYVAALWSSITAKRHAVVRLSSCKASFALPAYQRAADEIEQLLEQVLLEAAPFDIPAFNKPTQITIATALSQVSVDQTASAEYQILVLWWIKLGSVVNARGAGGLEIDENEDTKGELQDNSEEEEEEEQG